MDRMKSRRLFVAAIFVCASALCLMAPLSNYAPRLLTSPMQRIPRTNTYSCPVVQPDAAWLKSQSEEDLHLLQFFNGLCNGTYVELGALDGITFSNTHVFNKALDWKGVLLELSPSNFGKLFENRKNEIAVINAAVCAEARVIHYVERGPVGGIWEFAAPQFRDRFWGKDFPVSDAKEIQCLPLRQVLGDIADPFYADFLSLDVEGAELTVLESIDFRRAAFGVVLVEADEHNIAKNMDVRKLLIDNGYTFLYNFKRSDWFINSQYNSIYPSKHKKLSI